MKIEEARKTMQEGAEKTLPIVKEVTKLIMDAYEEGFKTCWKVITGEDLQEIKKE